MPPADPTLSFPKVIKSSQAKRLQKFLQHVDRQLVAPLSITVYGSAAVALYLADDLGYEYGYTRDIDIGHMEPDTVTSEAFNSQVVDPPLHFQTYDFTRWFLHPDWEDSIVDISPLLSDEQPRTGAD